MAAVQIGREVHKNKIQVGELQGHLGGGLPAISTDRICLYFELSPNANLFQHNSNCLKALISPTIDTVRCSNLFSNFELVVHFVNCANALL
jgi:hypothetical protein